MKNGFYRINIFQFNSHLTGMQKQLIVFVSCVLTERRKGRRGLLLLLLLTYLITPISLVWFKENSGEQLL